MVKTKGRTRSRKSVGSIYRKKFPPGYKYISTLGEGSFGRVVKAKDLDTNKIVAIKFQKISTFSQIQDYRTEIKNLEAFSDHCKHTVCVIDHGIYDGKIFIVMEYIDGKELDEYYLNKMRLRNTEKKLEKHFKDIIKTVKYMHKAGYAHSDIKPANIVVDKEDVVHLVDLGAACQKNPCSTVATSTYLAPDVEDYRDSLSHRKSGDIFAVGASLLDLVDTDTLSQMADIGFDDEDLLDEVKSQVSSPYLKKVLSLVSDKSTREKIWKTL
jgi:serine/threonine protein kinase